MTYVLQSLVNDSFSFVLMYIPSLPPSHLFATLLIFFFFFLQSLREYLILSSVHKYDDTEQLSVSPGRVVMKFCLIYLEKISG